MTTAAPTIEPAAVTDPAEEPEGTELHLAGGTLQTEVEAAPEETRNYRVWLVPEGVPTDDGRYMMPGSLTPRLDRLPLMASDETIPAHLGATFVGNLIDAARLNDADGTIYLTFSADFDSDDDGQEWRRMVDDDRIRGVSADLLAVRARIRTEDGEVVDAETGAPAEDQSWPDESVWFVIDEGLVMGGTLVPMPAFRNARVEPIAASAVIAGLPADWFQCQTHEDARRAARDELGRLQGHGAAWGTCLVGHQGCIIPPQSETGYALARRLDGMVPIYWQPNGDLYAHAPTNLPWWEAISWYETNCEVVGLAQVTEDGHGINLAGYCGEELSGRHLSGDWRPYPRGVGADGTPTMGHELIGWSIVNRPGFPVPEAIAAAIASGRAITGSAEPDCDCEDQPNPYTNQSPSRVMAAMVAAESPEVAPETPAEPLTADERVERLAAAVEALAAQLGEALAVGRLEYERFQANRRAQLAQAQMTPVPQAAPET